MGDGLSNSFLPPQGHAQKPPQVGAELQPGFFASQGCAQSLFQAATAPPPTPQAPAAERLQGDLLPVLAAAQESAAAAAVAAAPPAPAATSTVDTAVLKQPPAPPPPPLPVSAPAAEAAPPVSAATIAAAAATAVVAPTVTVAVAPVASALEKQHRARGPTSAPCAPRSSRTATASGGTTPSTREPKPAGSPRVL